MWFCSRTWTATQFCLGVLSSNRSSHGSKTANIWNILVISRLCKLCLCLSVRAKAEHSIVRDKHSRDRSVVRGFFSLFFIFSLSLSLSLSQYLVYCRSVRKTSLETNDLLRPGSVFKPSRRWLAGKGRMCAGDVCHQGSPGFGVSRAFWGLAVTASNPTRRCTTRRRTEATSEQTRQACVCVCVHHDMATLRASHSKRLANLE